MYTTCSGDVILLASASEFGFKVNITNVAVDDGLDPALLITLPQGVLLSRYVSIIMAHALSLSLSLPLPVSYTHLTLPTIYPV